VSPNTVGELDVRSITMGPPAPPARRRCFCLLSLLCGGATSGCTVAARLEITTQSSSSESERTMRVFPRAVAGDPRLPEAARGLLR